ncbi:MAG: hypothetical protein ABIR94_11995 [Rubrivivax sp.]
MNNKQPPARVPTLTEVIATEAAADLRPGNGVVPADRASVERVLAELRPWFEGELQQRLHAALDPALQVLHESLLKQLRAELEPLLHQALRRALAPPGKAAD